MDFFEEKDSWGEAADAPKTRAASTSSGKPKIPGVTSALLGIAVLLLVVAAFGVVWL